MQGPLESIGTSFMKEHLILQFTINTCQYRDEQAQNLERKLEK